VLLTTRVKTKGGRGIKKGGQNDRRQREGTPEGTSSKPEPDLGKTLTRDARVTSKKTRCSLLPLKSDALEMKVAGERQAVNSNRKNRK